MTYSEIFGRPEEEITDRERVEEYNDLRYEVNRSLHYGDDEGLMKSLGDIENLMDY